jgi:hypothetical protein
MQQQASDFWSKLSVQFDQLQQRRQPESANEQVLLVNVDEFDESFNHSATYTTDPKTIGGTNGWLSKFGWASDKFNYKQSHIPPKFYYLRDVDMQGTDNYLSSLIKDDLQQQDIYSLVKQCDKSRLTSLYIGHGCTSTNLHKDKVGSAAVNQLISCSNGFIKLWFVFDSLTNLSQFETLVQSETISFVSNLSIELLSFTV